MISGNTNQTLNTSSSFPVDTFETQSDTRSFTRHPNQTKFNFKRIQSGYGKDIRNINVDSNTALDWDGNNRLHRKDGIYNKIKESYRDHKDQTDPNVWHREKRAISLPRLMSATSTDLEERNEK